MASTSTTRDRPEREPTNTSQEIVPTPSTSAISSSRRLFSSCFDCVSFFLSWRSPQPNLMASSSITGRMPENDVTGAFERIAPSASTSDTTSTLMQKPCYDVFINHRGLDVKHTLASTLYNILSDMKVPVFLDAEELEYGNFFPTILEAAMRCASLHIAIFSKNYAKSSWCLAELSFMLKTGAKIIPIFYYVEPMDLRYIDQGKGMFVNAFMEHKRKRRYSLEQLQEWKKALYDVSFYTGEIIKNNDDEKRLLKNIVKCVSKAISNVPLMVAKHPVGLKETVEDFEMNRFESVHGDQVVEIVGIWGMGGSGKTTLAKEIYNKRFSLMERSSFIFDVRDAATKGLLVSKQIKLLKDLGVEGLGFDNIEEGKGILGRYLRSVRVLIVLDDVDHVDQLDALLPAKESLGGGSLIIVTTRENEVLRCWGFSSVYKMKALDPCYAKQLFCWHAFLQSFPKNGFEELVEKFVKACNGLPLSLKVFGGQLYGESRKDYWESLLHKISRVLAHDIKQRLKLSYDVLDNEEKEMFLDTACFLIGEESSMAIEVWNGSGWSGLYSWERLLNKCLIEVDEMNCIKMHDHLRDLGREIANQQSPYRLWFHRQIINVQKQEEKKIGIRGIVATSVQIEWNNYWEADPVRAIKSSSEVDEFHGCSLHGELMVNTSGGIWSLAPSLIGLKIFVIRGDYFNQVMGEVSRELVWLRWFQIGQRNLPSRVSMKNLRVLELYEEHDKQHHLEELWEAGDDAPVQLRELIISRCRKFRGFPNSVGCLIHLKKIVIVNGDNLTSLPEEFCLLQSLEHLVLHDCKKLSSLPSNFGDLSNLRHLNLFFSRKLRSLPLSFKHLVLLQYLNLKGCDQLTFAPQDLNILANMTKLEFLSFSECEQLEELPHHITNQVSLRELYLDDTRIRELPVNIGQLRRLQRMEIGSELLTGLPTSLGDLTSLTMLNINGCSELEVLPDSVGRLNLLEELIVEYSGLKSLPKSVRQLNNLRFLCISHCPLSELDLGAGLLTFALSNLKRLSLYGTELCRISISEDCCPRLETFSLEDNHQLTEVKALPTTVELMCFENCEMLRYIPSFAELTSLREFALKWCDQVEKIEGIEYCTRLESLTIRTCREIPHIKSLEHMEKLKTLQFRAIKGSAIENLIQTIQKWPDTLIICTRAVPDAASLVNCSLSPNVSVVDSFSNQKIHSRPKLLQKRSSNGDAILLCFVINWVSSQMELSFMQDNQTISSMEMDEGKWLWIGVFTQRSIVQRLTPEEFSLSGRGEDEVEKGLLVRGEEQILVKAFHSLLRLLES